MKTEIVYSSLFNNHDCMGHPEHAKRTDVMIDSLQNSELHERVSIIEPILLPEKLLYDVHSIDMIIQIKALSKRGNTWIDPDTYVCENDFETARMAAGGLLHLSKHVLDGTIDNGFALVRPPGHHATPYRSMGFCLFNNVAISASECVKQGKKVLIFDLDVHHGNGTQDIFYSSNNVLYQSFHVSPHFPGTGGMDEMGDSEGKGYTVNLPLPHYCGKKTIKYGMEEVFLPIAKEFSPDIILVSCGYDSHYTDQLGGLLFDVNYFGDIIKQLQSIQSNIVCTLEGGYNLDIIGNCFVSQIGQLCGKPQYFDDTIPEEQLEFERVKHLKKQMKDYWDI